MMLELVAFLCGAAVMVLEMAGARLLAPYLGTSIVVWTGLIGVILASLSLGYWLGGKLADRGPRAGLLGRFIAVAAFTVLLVAFVGGWFLAAVSDLSMSLYAASILAAAILFCPASVLLGMVSPYIIRVKIAVAGIDANHSGNIIGRFFALSTVGSIVGTFLGGYVLISMLGTRYILFSVAGALFLCALLVFLLPEPKSKKGNATGKKRRVASISLGLALCALGILGAGRSEREAAAAGVHEVDTRYNHIMVLDRDWNGALHRFLVTDPGKSQSSVRLDKPDELASAYCSFFFLTRMYQPQPSRVLMLGGGGYAVPRRLLYDADHDPSARPLHMDVVEIDPGMTQVAKDYFFLKDDPRLRISHEDGRLFLNRLQRDAATPRYDVALLDTFNSHYSIPFHLCTVESMRAVYNALTDDGVVAMNIIGVINGEKGRLFRSIYASVKQVFPEVRVFTVHGKNPDMLQNIVLVAAKKSPVAEHPLANREYNGEIALDMQPLTDDFAPVERFAIYD